MSPPSFTQRIAAIGIPGILLLLPLVHLDAVRLSAALPKAVFFSAAVLFLGITASVALFRDRRVCVPEKKVLIVLFFMILFAFLSSVFSPFPSESLRGAYAGFGMIDLLTLILFGWCVFLLFPTERLKILARTMAVAGTIPVLIGAAAIAAGATDLPVAIGTSLGHPNFLGQLLTLTLPMTAVLILTEERRWKVFSVILMIIQCAGLALTGSRAALLGTFVGCGLIALILLRSSRKARIGLAVVAGAALIIVLVANVLPSDPIVQSVPLLHRLTVSADPSDGHTTTQSFSVRGHLWRMAMEASLKRPILGYGQGGVTAALERHFHPELLTLERYDAVPDHVHSDPLERLLTGGILGLLAWMAFSFLVVLSGIVRYRKNGDPLILGLLAALVGHSIALLFGFPTIVDLAFVAVMSALLLRRSEAIMHVRSTVAMPCMIVLICSTGFALSDDIRALAADRAFHAWEQSSDPSNALADLHIAAAKAPHNAYIPYLATEYLAWGEYAEAERMLDASLASRKPDAHLWILRAAARLKQGDIAGAESDFRQASAFAPFSPHVWRTWGIGLAEAGDAQRAGDALEYLLSFSPQYWQWDGETEQRTEVEKIRYDAFFKQNPDFRTLFLHLGRARFMTGDSEGALEALSHARQNVDTLSTIGVILAEQGRAKEALTTFEQALESDPENEILKENVRILRSKGNQ